MTAGYTFIKAVITNLIIMFRNSCKDLTRNAIANITNSIIAIILVRGTNIRDTPGTPREWKNGRNETSNKEEWRHKLRQKAT